jgi:TolA-binding protein
MKRKFLLTLIFCLFFTSIGFAYWIWTPKTGKWINPKYSVKPTPQEQLAFAKIAYDTKDYKTAMAEFKKLIRYYPKSLEASEAQFYIGSCYENMNQPYEA